MKPSTSFAAAVGVAALGLAALYGGVVSPHPESWYRDRLAASVTGTTEAVCFMARADVLTSNAVYEVDKLEKHHECLGQALWYSWCFKRQPVMALIVPAADLPVYRRVKAFVESNSTVRVIGIQQGSGLVL